MINNTKALSNMYGPVIREHGPVKLYKKDGIFYFIVQLPWSDCYWCASFENQKGAETAIPILIDNITKSAAFSCALLAQQEFA